MFIKREIAPKIKQTIPKTILNVLRTKKNILEPKNVLERTIASSRRSGSHA
jgi:hypothetical protein